MYYSNSFAIYVSQSTILYTLNVYSDVCQLHPNKTGKNTQAIDSQLGSASELLMGL